jgi:hypothetical protein
VKDWQGVKLRQVETLPRELKPGDRCAVGGLGVVTFDRLAEESDGRVTLHWQEQQPAVTRHPSNAVIVLKQPEGGAA